MGGGALLPPHLRRRVLRRLSLRHHELLPSPVPEFPNAGTPLRTASLSPALPTVTTRSRALALALVVRLKLCVRRGLWREEAGRGGEGKGRGGEGQLPPLEGMACQAMPVGRHAPRQAVDARHQPWHLAALRGVPAQPARVRHSLV